MEPRMRAKGQRLDLQVYDPRPPALADPARIRQVVTNLVTNAHLYTPEGGAITLRLEGNDQATTITVADTGPGVSPEELRRLFDRFFRGSTDERKSPGTGLGPGDRQVARGPARRQRSTSTASSGAARRSRSGCRRRRGAVASRPSAAMAPGALAAQRVLIVDDEPALADLIAQQLRALGVQSVQVNSGAEALARLRSERFDAMTLDVYMPGMNGFDVLRAVRADVRLHNLPVVFVSVASRSPELAGQWAVPKPINRQRLTEVLGAAIQARRSRVLVVAPDELRRELEPALEALCAEHRWESTPQDAVRASAELRFEVALVHESLGATAAIVDGSLLRGRRYGRSVILFSTDGDGADLTDGVGVPVFGLTEAVSALRSALGDTTERGR